MRPHAVRSQHPTIKTSGYRHACVFALFMSVGCSTEAPRTIPDDERARITAELVDRLERDQFYRSFDYPSAPDTTRRRMMSEAQATDSANLVFIRDLVQRIGWPDSARFGGDASRAAFVLVQHADSDPDFQAQMLPVLDSVVKRGEASPADLAYLTDRVRVRQGMPQVYGTQYDVARDSIGSVIIGPDGRPQYLIPTVIEPATLDERRAAAGLKPWAEYEAEMAAMQGRTPVTGPLHDR
jgi:hypothetical protein